MNKMQVIDLMVEEELSEQAEVLTVNLVLLRIHLVYSDSLVSVDLLTCRHSLFALRFVVYICPSILHVPAKHPYYRSNNFYTTLHTIQCGNKPIFC